MGMRTISARCPISAADLKVPLYATPFTAGLIAGKLEEEGLTGQVKLNIVERGGSVRTRAVQGALRRACRTRSRKATGLLIETPHGRIFHTGDWKIDETPVLGEAPSTEALKRSATRACSPWCAIPPTSSRTWLRAPRRVCTRGWPSKSAKAPGRVVVTTFASNAARLQTIGRVATETGRRVCVAGRSLDRILRVAKATGYLRDFPEPVRFDEAMRLPRQELLIIATGGQGEPRAALGRIALGQSRAQAGGRTTR